VKLFRVLIRWYRRRREEAWLAEEIEQHRARVQADLEAHGMPPDAAAAASRRTMGNVTLAREDARDVWIAPWIAGLWRDVRYGLRGLRCEPTFTLTATLTFALGIATTTTVFSVADAELWKPLPFPDSKQLIAVYSRGPAPNAPVDGVSGADLLDWRAGTPALADLAGEGPSTRRVLRLDTAESVMATEVTANYFSTLGRPAVAGRTFTAEDAQGSGAAVLTDRAWRRLFDADPSIVGRSVALDAQSVTVVGVVAADDSLGRDPDVYIAFDERAASFLDRSAVAMYGGIGRLKPGHTAAVALAQLQAVAARVAQAYPDGRAGHRMHVEDLGESYAGYNWRPLFFFLGASLVVLVLSAVNVATLLVGRAFRRTREFALRGALGGGQGALARQLLVEGALLALPGGAIGVLLTTWAVAFFTAELPADFLARGSRIPIDLRVCAFAFGVTALTTVLFVLMPLLVARRINLSGALGPGARTGRSAGEGRARMVLLTAQMALTVILLAGAGIFLRSFLALSQVPLGFDPDDAVAIRSTLSGPRYSADEQVRGYVEALLARARAVPGVREAAIGSSSPLGSGPLVRFNAADRPAPATGAGSGAIIRAVTPGYFRTLSIRIVGGRSLTDADVAGAPRVAIVNEALVDQVFQGDNPVGRAIDVLPGARAPWTRRPGRLLVVGVAANVKEVGLNEVQFPGIYVPFAQTPSPWFELVVRAGIPPAGLATALRRAAAAVDPAVPVTSVSTFEQRVRDALQGDRFNLLLIAGFAAVAVLLAAIGVYGTIACAVEARTREFGVRLALGARPSRLLGAALWQAVRLALVGAGAGVAGTLVLARAMGDALYLVPGEHNGLLYQVSTTDPAMLACAFVGIVLVALVAATVPARRVARVDPVLALRSE
jgi:putative ABC transport system permease protein